MPFTVDEYDVNKVSFYANKKIENMFSITYNLNKGHILSGKINLSSHIAKFVHNKYKSNSKKLNLTLRNKNKEYEDEKMKKHTGNYMALYNLVEKIRKELKDEYMNKSYTDKDPSLSLFCDMELVYHLTNDSVLKGILKYDNKRYDINYGEFNYIIKSGLECQLELSPDYFFISNSKKDGKSTDYLRLGLVLKAIHIDEDQLDSLPPSLGYKLKYAIDPKKIEGIRKLTDMYNVEVTPYTSKYKIMQNVKEKLDL
jgi:hypothetical protein